MNDTATVAAHRHFIGGDWLGEPLIDRHDPAQPDRLVARVAEGDAETVALAVAAAAAAFDGWRTTPAPQRGRVLTAAAAIIHSRRAELARTITNEEGKTLREAAGEVQRCIDYLEFYGAEGWRLDDSMPVSDDPRVMVMTLQEPVGVVGLITPWNFPLAIATWKAAPALVAGNTVILKPAGLAPGAAVALAAALHEAGLPAGVLNLVLGDAPEVGAALVDAPQVDAISFTGSNRVGRIIEQNAARRSLRLQLELGGVNALVVLDDADEEEAARIVVAGAFGQSGQACTATRQVICTSGIYDRLVEAIRVEVAALVVGPGVANSTDIGPLSSAASLRSVLAAVDRAIAEGARAQTPVTTHGQYLHPVVLEGVSTDMKVANEEVFGAGACRAEGRRFRRGARPGELLEIRAHGRHHHRLFVARDAVRPARTGRNNQNQPPDARQSTERALRRTQGILQRPLQGTGPRRARLLHRHEVRIPRMVGEDPHESAAPEGEEAWLGDALLDTDFHFTISVCPARIAHAPR